MTTNLMNIVNIEGKGLSRVDRQIALGTLSAVMPASEAKKALGYSTKSNNMSRLSAETQEQIRTRLQQTKRYGMEASADFYEKISVSKSKKVPVDTKIRARTRLDTLVGNDSPAKMEIQQQTQIIAAVGVIHNLLGSGIDPAKLQTALKAHQETPQIDQKYTLPVYDNDSNAHNSLIINECTQDIESSVHDKQAVESVSEEPVQQKKVRSKKKKAGGGEPRQRTHT